MSKPIDEKITKMTLDNKDFVDRVADTVRAFDRLINVGTKVRDITLDKTTSSVNGLAAGVEKVKLSKLADAAIGVKDKFTAMSVVAITALQNITNRAINAGSQMLKSFTMDPVTEGFSEYEEKMNAIQVILSNTQGKSTLDDVKKSLSELNTYSDDTIYSFQDMTKNMGTFTAAGVDLETSQKALIGIANLAAVSGSNTQQAGSAMYQLSQAISAGKVGLQDWNSVVTAGMGGAKFRNALKANAKEFWDSADAGLSFRDSLQEGWLTADVLMKTLDQFSKDQSMIDAATNVRTFTQLLDTTKEGIQSGWATTWELVFGDYEASTKMWTKVSKVIKKMVDGMSDSRNKLIKQFNDIGGRKVVIEGLTNTWNALNKVVGIAKDAFREIFPAVTAQQIKKIAESFRDFTKSLNPSKEGAEKLKTVFKGVFALFQSIIIIAKRVGQTFLKLIPEGASSGLLDFLVKIADISIEFNKNLKSGKAMQGSFKALSFVISGVSAVAGMLFGTLMSLPDAIDHIVNNVSNLLGPAFENVQKQFESLTEGMDNNDLANGGLAVAIVVVNQTLKKFKTILSDGLDTFFGKLSPMDNIKDTLDALGESLQTFTANIKVNMLLKIAAAVGVLALSIKILSTIDPSAAIMSLELLGLTMVALTVTFSKVSAIASKSKGLFGASVALVAIGAAVVALSIGLKILSTVKPQEMAKSLLALAAIAGTLVASMKLLSKMKGPSLSTAIGMQALAGSVVVLAGAVYILSSIKQEDLVKGLVALGAIFAEIAIFSTIMKRGKISPASAIGMAIITASIISMSATAVALGQIDVDTLVQGLATIGAMLLGIAVFAKLMKGNQFVASATGMTILAGAISGLAIPVMQFGTMDIDSIVRGLGALAGIMVILSVALKANKGSAGAAAGLTLVATAMLLLVPSFMALSQLSLPQIGAGLLAMAGAFTVIGVAGALLGPIAVTSLLPFAAALLAMGVSVAATGLGLLGIAAALASLAALSTTAILTILNNIKALMIGLIPLIPIFVAFVKTLVTQMAWGISTTVPSLARALGSGILAMLTAANDYLPDIVKKGMELVTNLMNGISEKEGDLIEAGVKMIISFVNGIANALRDNSEELVSAAMNIMEAILEVMVDGLVAVVNVLFGWIPGFEKVTGSLGNSAKGALRDAFNVKDTGDIGKKGAKSTVDGIDSKKGDAKKAGTNVAEAGKQGLGSKDASSEGNKLGSSAVSALQGKTGAASSAGSSVAGAGKDGLGSKDASGEGSKLGGSAVSGIESQIRNASSSGTDLAKEAKTGIGSISAEDSGNNFGQGFANGISGMVDTVRGAAEGLANKAKGFVEKVLKIFSPSRVMREDGGYFGQGFVLGIEDEYGHVENASGGMAEKAVNAFKGIGAQVSDALDGSMDMEPVIAPVLDLTNIKPIDDFSLTAKPKYAPRDKPSDPDSNNGGSYNYDITINTQAQDPKAVAREVEKIIVRGVS